MLLTRVPVASGWHSVLHARGALDFAPLRVLLTMAVLPAVRHAGILRILATIVCLSLVPPVRLALAARSGQAILDLSHVARRMVPDMLWSGVRTITHACVERVAAMTARELLAVLVIGMVQNYSRKFHIGPALLCAVFARRSCESHNITVIESRAIHTPGLVTNCAIAVMDTLTLVAVLLSEMTAAAVAEMLAVATVLCAVLLNARSRAAAARLCVALLRLTRMRTNVSAESWCS